jgi:hypothetical protein
MKLSLLAAAAIATMASGAFATSVQVNSFAPTDTTPGVWGVSDPRTGTTGSSASIVDLTGAGGNLENNQPLPTGAGKITTDSTNASMAEVGIANNYGLASSVIPTINLAFSYYKAATAGNAASAPSLKLTFLNSTYASTPGNDGFVTLVYEPYWNSGGTVATDTWLTDSMDATNGLFWANGGFGQANGAGGPPLHTLSQWLTAFDSTSSGAFSQASLLEVRIGMGSYQPDQIGYFDKVVINGTAQADTTYDFEAGAAVPLPAAAWGGLALLGGLAIARRRKSAAVPA